MYVLKFTQIDPKGISFKLGRVVIGELVGGSKIKKCWPMKK